MSKFVKWLIIDKNYIWLSLLGCLLYIPFLGSVHLFDWDEINFAESAREMIVSGDYLTVQIDFIPFWEKPPLFIWMQVLSMKIFGINEFAARFPNSVAGIVTLISLYHVGKQLFNPKIGIWWAICFGGSLLPFIYFKSGIIDPWFNLFTFWGVYWVYRDMLQDSKPFHAIQGGLAIGLAVLTKGPVAFLIFLLTIVTFMILAGRRSKLPLSYYLQFFIALALSGGAWFILQIINGNYTIIQDFIIYQVRLFKTKDAGHGGFLLYHFVVVLIGVFPASIVAIASLKRAWKDKRTENPFSFLMLIWLAVILILFTIVKTKILHYSSMAYFPVTFLAAYHIQYLLEHKQAFKKWTVGLFLAVPFLLISGLVGLVALYTNKKYILEQGWIKDPFAAGNFEAEIPWSWWDISPALVLLIGILIFSINYRKNLKDSLLSVFATNALFLFLIMWMIVGKIEGHSQRAAIEFFKENASKDVYLHPLGYKSYAQFFYGERKPPLEENPNYRDENWLKFGNIDKDVHFACKIHKWNKYQDEIPDLEELYRKNGFVFGVRRAK